MKYLYTALGILILSLSAKSQAVLNEIYAIPSPTNHEFFELYNTSTSQTPISVDGYSLVNYFDEGRKQGFYVLDLPNMTMNSKGHFVGSASIPFSYQGVVGSSQSDFSWNDADFRNGITNGYIKRWVKSTDNLLDGNLEYDEESVPATFNDFFSKIKGGGASYHSFLFKDGILQNTFLGGTGGSTTIPSEITSMPALNLQSVTALGNHNYTINFANYTNDMAEVVTQEIGTDNGFIRMNDGMCGTWDKSSAQAFHTPKAKNSSVSQMTATGSITLETHITRGAVDGDSSFITYNLTAGPTSMFPVEIYIYADNGTVDDEWDANDEFLQANVETIVSDGPFTTKFLPQNQELILVAKTALGCYDQVRLVLNPEIVTTTLPVKLKFSAAKALQQKAFLEWAVISNEEAAYFEIEKSTNQQDFFKVATLAASAVKAEAYYTFIDDLLGKTYYRIKVIGKTHSTFYSPVMMVKNESQQLSKLSIVSSNSNNTLFNYYSSKKGYASVRVFTMNGVEVMKSKQEVESGSNIISVPTTNKWRQGMYVLEVQQENEKTVTKFIQR